MIGNQESEKGFRFHGSMIKLQGSAIMDQGTRDIDQQSWIRARTRDLDHGFGNQGPEVWSYLSGVRDQGER